MGAEEKSPLPDVDALVEERAAGLEQAYLEEELPEAQTYDEERILAEFKTYVTGQRRLNELRQLLTPGDHVTARALDRAPAGKPEQREQHARLKQLENAPDQSPALVVLFALFGSRTFQDDLRGKTLS